MVKKTKEDHIIYEHPHTVHSVTHGTTAGSRLFWKEVDLELGVVSNNHIVIPDGYTGKVLKRSVVLTRIESIKS